MIRPGGGICEKQGFASFASKSLFFLSYPCGGQASWGLIGILENEYRLETIIKPV